MILYQEGDSWVHHLHPLTKLTAAVCLVVLAFTVTSVVAAWVLLALTVIVAYSAGIERAFLGTMTKVFIPLSVVLILVHGVFTGRGETVLIGWQQWTLLQEGLLYALLIIARLAASISAFYLLVLTTHPDKLISVLVERGLSPKLGFAITAAFQMIPHMQMRAEKILEAQQSRGVETQGSLRQRIAAYFPLITPLVLGAFSGVEARAMALEARAFGTAETRTSLYEIEDQAGEQWARLALIIGTAVAAVASTVGRLVLS